MIDGHRDGNMTFREQLIGFADNNPEELGFIFAREMGAEFDPDIHIITWLDATDNSPMVMLRLHNLCWDWTAVINAIEKAGILEWYVSKYAAEIANQVHIDQRPHWRDCCALMICAILIKQQENTK